MIHTWSSVQAEYLRKMQEQATAKLQAERAAGGPVRHKRDENGHLVCQGSCGEAYPYAEPPADGGRFVCKHCRLFGDE